MKKHFYKNPLGDMVEFLPIRLSDLNNFIIGRNLVTGSEVRVHDSCIITKETPVANAKD